MTPLAQYEGAIGSTAEITIDWNAFRTLWLPLLKGPLANLYKTKVLHTGENARAGDERVILETLQNRDARLNTSAENRAVIEEGVAIADDLAANAGVYPTVNGPITSLTPQLSYEQQKKLLSHQKRLQDEKYAAIDRILTKQLNVAKEESHQLTTRVNETNMLGQLNDALIARNAANDRIAYIDARNTRLQERNEDLQNRYDGLQGRCNELQAQLNRKRDELEQEMRQSKKCKVTVTTE